MKAAVGVGAGFGTGRELVVRVGAEEVVLGRSRRGMTTQTSRVRDVQRL